MPRFRCSQCGCVEHTACSNYWADVHYLDQLPRCSACDPTLGRWHGRFERQSADGWLLDQNGLLWTAEDLAAGRLPRSSQIVGQVPVGASTLAESSGAALGTGFEQQPAHGPRLA